MLNRTACKPTDKEIDQARNKEIDQAFGRSFGKSVARLERWGCPYLQK